MVAQTQIAGFTTTSIMEVEANTKAARMTLRDIDYGALGIYSLGDNSGIMAAGLAANSPIWSMRWSHATNLALIKRVVIGAGCDTVSFAAAAAAFSFGAFIARSFTVADTGGTSILPSGSMNKLRTSGMGTTLFADIRRSATATLTAGTRTLDSQAIGTLTGGVIAGAGAPMLSPFPLFEALPGMHPAILAQNEGLIIQATVPGTGTWKFSIRVDWAEVTAY